jgi:hypothetical protein
MSVDKSAMWQYLARERGLNDAQLAHLAATGFDIQKRREYFEETDPEVKRMVGNSSGVKEFKDIFKHATRPPRFLQGGAYGITALMHLPGIPSPVVVKFTEKPDTGDCAAKIGKMLCRKVGGDRGRTYQWTANSDAARERRMYMYLSGIEDMGSSPHFLHTYIGSSFRLQKRASIRQVALWLGADKRKAGKYGDRATTALGVNIIEYGGATMPDIVKSVVGKQRPDLALAMMKSAIVQVMQAIAAMANYGVRHNDLHSENIMGSVIATPYLYYNIVTTTTGRGKVADKDLSRVFRVPTYGILWRVIDFGLATCAAKDVFGELDHGIMARTAFGGPMWPGAVGGGVFKRMPLETFDLSRVLSSLQSDVSVLPRESKGKVRNLLEEIAVKAVSLGKETKDTVAIEALHSLAEVDSREPLDTVQADIKSLARGCKDHGLMIRLFMHTAAKCGFEITGDKKASREATEANLYTMNLELA